MNSVKEKAYRGTTSYQCQRFKHELEKLKIPVTIRRSLGQTIEAACGQLRNKYEELIVNCETH